ncbi:GNAT domain-containing protein [Stachybotrys elegans]|uniref:GNAT domain-containing protein n=1 Tax=Stachybotrys elegans TaxID=80388 RepID=A0A8K0T061_9HYPO|nr:GNAT domain-containing protein [Stachybotrys elegans]
MFAATEIEMVEVETTIPQYPLPPAATRPAIRTERLVLKPLSAEHLEGIHALRLQEDVMKWTTQARPDKDMEESRAWLERFLPPNDTKALNYAICLGDTEEVIGIGGSHIKEGELGWPELGYMLRKEAWGNGYATEFLRAFLQAWWALPRARVQLKVDKSTILDADAAVKQECLVAITEVTNRPSQSVLRKAGFSMKKVWFSADDHKIGSNMALIGFLSLRPLDM